MSSLARSLTTVPPGYTSGKLQPNIVRWWAWSRLATLLVLFGYEGWQGVAGDIMYFAHSLGAIPERGLVHTLAEYPLPAVGVLAVPWALGAVLGAPDLFPPLLITSALVADAAFTMMLARQRATRRSSAVLFWLLAVPLLGGIVLARFDLVTGVLVAMAVRLAHARPRLASALLAVATAVKLWPVILLPSLLSATERRGRVLTVFVAVGALVVLGCLWLAGWGRLVSPSSYQVDRGLQVEAPLAAPAMVGWLVDGSRWHVGMSAFRSVDVTGPGVPVLVSVSTALTLGLLVGLGVLWRRAWRRTAPVGSEVLLWLALTSVCGYLVTAKVFSPQYLLWVLPVVAVGLVVAPSDALRRWAVGLLLVTALTHLVYPLLYRGLVIHLDWSGLAVAVLVLRNLAVVALFVAAVHQAWRLTADASAPVTAPDPVVDEAEASRAG